MPGSHGPRPACWVSWSRVLRPGSVGHLLSDAERVRLVEIARRDDAAAYATSRALLRTELARWTGLTPEEIVLSSRCVRCGGAHGRVTAITRQGESLPAVSLTRRSGIVAVALSAGGEVGVDVEAVDGAGFVGFDKVAMHPAEMASTAEDRSRLWARKEALLKATGDGLRVDPRKLRVTAAGSSPGLVEWADHTLIQSVWMFDIAPAQDYVGCVCVLGPVRPAVSERPEALAAIA